MFITTLACRILSQPRTRTRLTIPATARADQTQLTTEPVPPAEWMEEMERIEQQLLRTSSPFGSSLPIPIQLPEPHYHTQQQTPQTSHPANSTPINVQISPSYPTNITITITVPLRTSPDTRAHPAGEFRFGLGLLCTTGAHDMHDPVDDSLIPGPWCWGFELDWSRLD
jgi:hypothetical protein